MTNIADLEREVSETRDRLNGTIDRIQDKLTVSGMVDEFMGQAGVPRLESGQDFILGLLRRHPVPVMIAAAGIGFLIYKMNKRESDLVLPRVHEDGFADMAALPVGQTRPYDPDAPHHHAAVAADTRPDIVA